MSAVRNLDPLDPLRTRARILHRKAMQGDKAVLSWVSQYLTLSSDGPLKRRHFLAALAQSLGFQGWPHIVHVVTGGAVVSPAQSGQGVDFGTLLYPHGSEAFSNVWVVEHPEASRIREEVGGFLLAYRRQYLVVDSDFVAHLSLDPQDPDWRDMNYDWAAPHDVEARSRLYGKLLSQRFQPDH